MSVKTKRIMLLSSVMLAALFFFLLSINYFIAKSSTADGIDTYSILVVAPYLLSVILIFAFSLKISKNPVFNLRMLYVSCSYVACASIKIIYLMHNELVSSHALIFLERFFILFLLLNICIMINNETLKTFNSNNHSRISAFFVLFCIYFLSCFSYGQNSNMIFLISVATVNVAIISSFLVGLKYSRTNRKNNTHETKYFSLLFFALFTSFIMLNKHYEYNFISFPFIAFSLYDIAM